MKSKKGSFTTGQIFGLILGLIIFAMVIYWMVDEIGDFIIRHIKNLPGYDYPETDIEIDLTTLPEDQIEKIKSSCPILIGRIEFGKIIFCKGNDFRCSDEILSNLIWNGDGDTAEIVVDVKYSFDPKISDVKKGIIKLDGGFDKYVKENLILIKQLDGAYYFYGNLICHKVQNQEVPQLTDGEAERIKGAFT